MGLSIGVISQLLDQGAITSAQADQLAAQAQPDSQPVPVPAPDVPPAVGGAGATGGAGTGVDLTQIGPRPVPGLASAGQWLGEQLNPPLRNPPNQATSVQPPPVAQPGELATVTTPQSAPMTQPPAPPQIPSYGLPGMQTQLAGLSKQAGQNAADYNTAMTGASKDQLSAIDQTAAIEKQKATEAYQAGVQRANLEANYNAKQAELYRRHREVVASGEKEYADKMEDAKHFQLSHDDRVQYQATLADPNASNQDKAIAKEKLEDAQNIDPRQAFGNAAGKIMAALAMALGSYASAFTGRNDAMTIINKAIDDNVAAQKDKRAARLSALGEVGKKMNDANRRFADERDQTNFEKASQLQTLDQMLANQALSHGGDEVGARATQMRAQVQQELAKTNAEYSDRLNARATQTVATEATIAEARSRLAEENMRIAAAGRAERSPIPGTKVYDPSLPIDKESVKEAREAAGAYAVRKDLMDKITEFRSDDGNLLDPKRRAAAKIYAARLLDKVAEASGGRMTPETIARLKEGLGGNDPTSFMPALNKILTVTAQDRAETEKYLNARNVSLADTQARNAKYAE